MKGFLEFRRRMKKDYPFEPPTRCSGRSLSQAFMIVGEALSRPGRGVDIVDHYGTRQADKHLCAMVMDLIQDQELEGFTLDRTNLRLRYDLPY